MSKIEINRIEVTRKPARVISAAAIIGALLLFVGCQTTPGVDASRSTHAYILNFKNLFIQFWESAHGLSSDEQIRLWDRLIEKPYSSFYDQVVWDKSHQPDWPIQKVRLLTAQFGKYASHSDKIMRQFETLENALPKVQKKFQSLFSDATFDYPVFLALAPSFDAKGAVLSETPPQTILALAVDSLVLENLDVEIILGHEFFHVYHAGKSGFLNDGVMAEVSLLTPLWEEGLATYVSQLLNPKATDGEVLLDETLAQISNQDLQILARHFLAVAIRKVLDPNRSTEFRRWFNVVRQSERGSVPPRAGYLLGLTVVRLCAQQFSLSEMSTWTVPEAANFAQQALKKLSQTKSDL